jgi:transposase InsO family protein
MDEHDREAVALFRYGLIAPLLHGNVQDKADYLAEASNKVYQVPYYGSTEYSPKTIQAWLGAYQRDGLDALKPRSRSDKGKPRVIPLEARQRIVELREGNTNVPATVFYQQLVEKGVLKPQDVSYCSVYRFLKRLDLVGKRLRKEPERKRFEVDTVNELWQTDFSSGPYLKVGKKKVPTSLFAFLDDASRLIPFAGFTLDESFDSLKVVFKEALCRRGVPQKVYTDNGKIYTSRQFQFVCASLGIALIHAKPYDAAAKGKIERFFLTAKERCYSVLAPESLTSLEALNRAFAAWLEKDYNGRTHSATGMTPLDKYMSQASQVRALTDPASLDPLFLRRETRKVRHDSTITIGRRLFEVPPRYIGQSIEVRFEPHDLGEVLVYDDDAEVARVRPVNLADNARVKRDKLGLRLSDIAGGTEE